MGRLAIIPNILSKDPDVALSALKSVGHTLHSNKRVDHISDNDVSAMLRSLSQLITSTDNEELCSVAMWCLEGKELSSLLLKIHIDSILEALVHAINNPMKSKSISHKAMEVLAKVLQKVPDTDTSSFWAPAVYRKLLSTDQNDCDASEKCLTDLESLLLPPSLSLSQVVVKDINETLLPKMENMVKTKTSMLTTVRAWGWLVKLLGGLAGQHRLLVNKLLKLLEITFVSKDEFVRLASLVSWKALIDALLQPSVISGMDTSITPPSFGGKKPFMGPSLKRIKLLMMPIETIIRTERDEAVRLACWRTWAYFAHKIGPVINQLSVTTAVVTPIFEEIFKCGPGKENRLLWDFCLNALEDWVSCKLRDKLDSSMLRVVSDGDMENRIASPKTPICHVSGLTDANNLIINWTPWSLDSLNLILQLVKALWDFGIKELTLNDPSLDNLSVNGALRLLVLVVKGVEDDGRASIQPSKQHVDSVHTLLKFVSGIAFDCVLVANQKDLISAVWAAVESLTELKSLVLSSMFYKIALQHLVKQEKSRESYKELSGTGKEGIAQNGACDVTPIVFVLGVWLRFGFRVMNEEGNNKFMERVERLSLLAIAGLGIMGNLFGISHVLNWLLYLNSNVTVGESLEPTDAKPLTVAETSFHKSRFLMHIWKVFAEQVTNYLESANVVPAIEGGVGDSGYQVIQNFLLFPIQIHIQDSCPGRNGELGRSRESMEARSSEDTIDPIITTWLKLFNCVSHISALISSRPNFFTNALCQRILMLLEEQVNQEGEDKYAFCESISIVEILGSIIGNVLKQTEISTIEMLAASRKKRLGGLIGGPGLLYSASACEIDDRSNIQHIFFLASRILDMSCDEIVRKRHWLGPASRILEELATFVTRLHSQQDVLIFLQCFSNIFAKWLQSSYSTISFQQDPDIQQQRLKVSLEQAWQRHLAGLESHIPLHYFDSDLLLIQASALLAAFQHPQGSISSCTLSFWEATYGRRTTSLKYPACLIPIFSKLKSRVKVSLPGWPQEEASKDSGGFSGHVALPYKGKRWRQMLQHQLLDIKDDPQYNARPSKLVSACLTDSETAVSKKSKAYIGSAELGAKSLEAQIGDSLSIDSSLNNFSPLPQKLAVDTSSNSFSPMPETLSVDTSLTRFSHVHQTLKYMNRVVETSGEFSRAIIDVAAANTSSTLRVENEVATDAVISCNTTKSGKGIAIPEPDSEACARRKKLKFLDVVRDISHCASVSEDRLKEVVEDLVVELVGETLDASHNNSKQCVDAKEEETRRAMIESEKRILKRCKDGVPHEVRNLGVKRRFLRSSGYLRGGKFWRDTMVTAKKSQKISIKPGIDATGGSITEEVNVAQRRKRGRPRKVQGPEEVCGDKTVKAEKERRKKGRPRKLKCYGDEKEHAYQTCLKTMINCREVNPHARADGVVVNSEAGVIDRINDTCGLSQQMLMACDPGGDELIAKQDAVLGSLLLPFRVQTLNPGILCKAITSHVNGQLEGSNVSTRPHRRKSSFPKRIPIFHIEESLAEEEYSKKVKIRKHEEQESKNLKLSPSKMLRSGKKLRSPACNPSLLFNTESSDIEECVQLENKTDLCQSNVQEGYKGSSSCMASIQSCCNDNNGVIEICGGGCISLPLKDQLDTLAPQWRICDLLAAICSSPQWRSMKFEDLACAQKHMWSIMGIISENKEKLLNNQYHLMS